MLARWTLPAFGAGTGATRHTGPSAEEKAARAAAEGKGKVARSGKPVIVIDPGHGGIDPGATSAGSVAEKTIVLAVAQHLQGPAWLKAAATT